MLHPTRGLFPNVIYNFGRCWLGLEGVQRDLRGSVHFVLELEQIVQIGLEMRAAAASKL
jgi:hypothetical protein